MLLPQHRKDKQTFYLIKQLTNYNVGEGLAPPVEKRSTSMIIKTPIGEKKIRDLACSFFTKDEDVSIEIIFLNDSDKIKSTCKIIYNNKEYFGDYEFIKKDNKYYNNYSEKYDENIVLKSFYKCALIIKNIKLPWGVMCGVRPAKNISTFKDKGLTKEEIFEMFNELYGADEKKLKLAYEVSQNERKIIENTPKDSVSIYIGIPFCPTRCLYCSFVSTDIRVSGKYMNDFVDNLLIEIEKSAQIIKESNKKIDSIYIGGGTPTALDEINLEKMLSKIYTSFDIDNVNEYTLEAGRVDTITQKKLELLKKYGVKRISINPQTMNNKTLSKINRNHNEEDIKKAFSLAKDIGFWCINADLIAGLPNENTDDFKYSLDNLIKLNPQNITIHTMCVKRASTLNFANINLTSATTVSNMVDYGYETLKQNGYIPYYMYRQKYMIGNLENVGYSKQGYFSPYNVNIMEENQTIIALGGGGSSKIVKKNGIERIFNFKDPVEYIRRFDEIIKRKDDILKIINEDR